jgi:hypothetical protein
LAAILVLAVYPQLVLRRSQDSVGKSVDRTHVTAVARLERAPPP